MRRSEVRESVDQILKALDSSGISKFLESKERGRKNDDAENKESTLVFLEALKKYAVLESHFNSTTRKIAEILKLDGLCNVDLWKHAFGDHTVLRSHFGRIYSNAKDLIPQFLALLVQKDAENY